MTTFKTKTLLAKDADWQTISNQPLIEMSMQREHYHHKNDQLLKTAGNPVSIATKKFSQKLGGDIKASFCNVTNIPGKLFEKNERLLSFVEHISCS